MRFLLTQYYTGASEYLLCGTNPIGLFPLTTKLGRFALLICSVTHSPQSTSRHATFHFPILYLVSSQPLPEGRAGTTSEQ